MSFKDYSVTPSANTQLSDGTYIGPNMLRNKVRPALQQLAADGRDLADYVDTKITIAKGDPGPPGSVEISGVEFITPQQFGAVGNGVTNDSAAFAAAVATGKNVYVPAGTYLLATGIALQEDQVLYGTGPKSVIRFTGSERCITVGSNSQVRDLRLKGDGKAAGKPFQTGIFCQMVRGWHIHNCDIQDFSGADIENGGGGIFCSIVLNTGSSEGGRITNCRIYNNNCGLNYAQRGEYVVTEGCVIDSNNTGIYQSAGNLTFSACNIHNNLIGVKLASVVNDGHSVYTGCLINHNPTTISADGIINGMSFTNCMLYIGDITLNNCTGFRFVNCDLAGSSFSFNLTGTCTHTLVAFSRFPKSPNVDALVLNLNDNTLTEVSNFDF